MLTGNGRFYFDTLTILGTDLIPDYNLPNLSTLIVTRGYRTLPNGTTYSAAVGNIALGAQASNMSFGTQNGSLLTGYLAAHDVVPSSSVGLHIGSASLRIPGSLWVGGYDQNRIVGPVSSQAYSQNGFPIDLLDISIGVAVGKSPFNVSSVSGLLAQGNSSLVPSLLVEVDSKEPYLYLPESTCRAIASWLPVTYNADFGLYIWDTQNPQYQRIVASPAYLAFTFRLSNAAVQNFTIRLPFKLLNLSLTEPLMDTPTPYFPCSLPTLPNYRLGRSFLQAAFMGVNWMTDNHGVWFLAQAPGPNIGPQPQVVHVEPLDGALQQSEQNWEDTWRGIWAPIAEDGQQPTPSPMPTAPVTDTPKATDSSGPSTGLIAGIAVGAVALAATAVAGILILRRRRKKNERKNTATDPPGPSSSQLEQRGVDPGLIEHLKRHHLSIPRELRGDEAAAELAGYMPQTSPVELDAGCDIRTGAGSRSHLGDIVDRSSGPSQVA
jgi:hypothetical protein